MKIFITIKNLLMPMVFSVATLGGYQAYEYANMTTAEILMMENVEALTTPGEPGGGTIITGSSMTNGSKTFHTAEGSKECIFTPSEPNDCGEGDHWRITEFNKCEETNSDKDKCDTSKELERHKLRLIKQTHLDKDKFN